ncbi:MAG: glycosyl hydrolase [Bacteroidota bacterium]|nr:glycosyl hydrolase [Bacteroidota bacterium]
MFRKFILILGVWALCLSVAGQNMQKLPRGVPDRSPNLDVLPGFKNPPMGYGEVPYYWWIGDTLTKDRIIWQLEQLKNKGITGLQVNYCHTDKGGASYGLTYPSKPALFSDNWWSLFHWFLNEAQKRDMSVSLSDYTLGAAGQGWFVDEMLKENPRLHGSKLESKQYDVDGNHHFVVKIPEEIVAVYAFKNVNGVLNRSVSIDLKKSIRNSLLDWNVPSGNWKIILVYKITVETSFDPMNPLSGPKLVEKFYQRFEDHCPGESGKGLNFFFSDELNFGIRGFLWNDAFATEFKKRKGYDIVPELTSLFADLGPRSYKVRLDYNDVMVSLSEEGFFKPVYEWHTNRGMLFGCDHGGRGKDVTEFGDYFRAQRWMSGPGCDQPGLGKDIVKDKVASSISHLYKRPRTWLEGFYGSGWGTSSEEVADATFANFAMGQNLLSLHGLYYTTHGSWWEWAAPDNHFRQPYWANMGDFLKCTERLSYVLSQGYHRCDVAMVYPVAPVEANLKGDESTTTAFSIAKDIYPAGIDFDFMDFESLVRCQIQNKELNVSGEKYKILILPSLSAVRYSTIEKALEFFRSGGIVLAVGALPEVSDRIGGNDKKLQSMIKEMFGITYSDNPGTGNIYTQHSKAGGTGMFILRPLDVKNEISRLIEPDFKVLSENVNSYILHRKLGERDMYFVYGVPKGMSCIFRCTGKAELWNPWTGTTKSLKVLRTSQKGTILELPLEKNEPQLIVFSPGMPEIGKTVSELDQRIETLKIDNNWEFELKPTLDNRFGDYRLPAFNGKLGVEVWKMKYADETTCNSKIRNSDSDASNWTTESVSYGPQFRMLGPLSNDIDTVALEAKLATLDPKNIDQPVEINGVKYFWKPYEFSWRWGLKDDAGHQGYHGLKGQVNNELIALGKIDKSEKAMPVYQLKEEKEGSVYYLWSTVIAPRQMQAKMDKSGLLPIKVFVSNAQVDINDQFVELKAGSNPLLLKYNKVGRGYFVFEDSQINTAWKQSVPLATEWYLNPKILPFNCSLHSKKSFGWYRFMSPPGARVLYVTSKSKPEVWISGKEYPCQPGELEPGRIADRSLPVWKTMFPDTLSNSCAVALRIEQLPGFYGGAAIPEPIVFECSKGRIQLGDLGENESLKTYSGGIWYRKVVNISSEQSSSDNITLDLGRVVASAEVFINGQSAGTKISSPWKFDLTGKLKPGDNKIEILVYNTLGNHYLTTPSMYIGRTTSGLIGPVKIDFFH